MHANHTTMQNTETPTQNKHKMGSWKDRTGKYLQSFFSQKYGQTNHWQMYTIGYQLDPNVCFMLLYDAHHNSASHRRTRKVIRHFWYSSTQLVIQSKRLPKNLSNMINTLSLSIESLGNLISYLITYLRYLKSVWISHPIPITRPIHWTSLAQANSTK